MFEELILNLEILRGELNVEGILIIEHREEKIINHVLQSNGEFANWKEKCMKRGRLMVHQMSQTFGIPRAF